MYVYIYICSYIYIYIYVCIYVYVYMYMYIDMCLIENGRQAGRDSVCCRDGSSHCGVRFRQYAGREATLFQDSFKQVTVVPPVCLPILFLVFAETDSGPVAATRRGRVIREPWFPRSAAMTQPQATVGKMFMMILRLACMQDAMVGTMLPTGVSLRPRPALT